MTDLETATKMLAGHTLALCKAGEVVTSDLKGISPMLTLLGEGRDLSGFSAADLVVGKAAAMLFVKANVKAVFAKTLSLAGRDYLDQHGIPVTFETLTERIMNREQTDVCPMERAVADTDDVDEGCRILQITLNEVRRKSKP